MKAEGGIAAVEDRETSEQHSAGGMRDRDCMRRRRRVNSRLLYIAGHAHTLATVLTRPVLRPGGQRSPAHSATPPTQLPPRTDL